MHVGRVGSGRRGFWLIGGLLGWVGMPGALAQATKPGPAGGMATRLG